MVRYVWSKNCCGILTLLIIKNYGACKNYHCYYVGISLANNQVGPMCLSLANSQIRPTFSSLAKRRVGPMSASLANNQMGSTLSPLANTSNRDNYQSICMRPYCNNSLIQQVRTKLLHGRPGKYLVFWACGRGISMQQVIFMRM